MWDRFEACAIRALLPVVVLALIATPCTPAPADTPVDVELVLAVDASDSMEEWEWRLEMVGIAATFRSKPVQEVIASLPHRRIAVALVVWADASQRSDASVLCRRLGSYRFYRVLRS